MLRSFRKLGEYHITVVYKLLAEQASRFEETLGSEKTLRIPELWKAAENFMAGGFLVALTLLVYTISSVLSAVGNECFIRISGTRFKLY